MLASLGSSLESFLDAVGSFFDSLAEISFVYLLLGLIAFTAYLTLVGRMGPERAAYCTVLFPVVALNISVFVEGYQWTAPALFGLLLVMLGNVLVFRQHKPASVTPEPGRA